MYSSKKPITPFSLSFCLTMCILSIFVHLSPWHYPSIFCCTSIIHLFTGPARLWLPSPFLLSDPWTHTFLLSVSVCLLNSATHHSSFCTLPLHIFLPLHPFICFIHAHYHSSSFCQTEISSLYPQATNYIISSPTVRTLSVHLSPLTFSHPRSLFLPHWTAFCCNKDALQGQ